MKFNREILHRRSLRLKHYDYAQTGFYFVTICTWQREGIFGELTEGKMKLNEHGLVVSKEWLKSSTIRTEIELDEFIIMPNHIHGIVTIRNSGQNKCMVGANGRSPLRMKPRSLSSFIAGFKSSVTKSINLSRNTPGRPLWQRNYYERIIRNEPELFKVRKYIQNNPYQWNFDEENPNNFNK